MVVDPDTGIEKSRQEWAETLGVSYIAFSNYCLKLGDADAIRKFKGPATANRGRSSWLENPETGDRMSRKKWADVFGISCSAFISYCRKKGETAVFQYYKEQQRKKFLDGKDWIETYGITYEEFFAYCLKHGEEQAVRHFNLPVEWSYPNMLLEDPETGEQRRIREWATIFHVSEETLVQRFQAKGERNAFRYFREQKKKKQFRYIKKWTKALGITYEELCDYCRYAKEKQTSGDFDISVEWSGTNKLLKNSITGEQRNVNGWAKVFGISNTTFVKYCQRAGITEAFEFYQRRQQKRYFDIEDWAKINGITYDAYYDYCRKHGEVEAVEHFGFPKKWFGKGKIIQNPMTGEWRTETVWAETFGVLKTSFIKKCRKLGIAGTFEYFQKRKKR
jgi:AraC-like DNA-binding protein